MVSAIIKEIEMSVGYLNTPNITSIYFGGGTPSLLESNELATIVEKLSKLYRWNNNLEFTLEANPDDLNPEKIKEFTAIGVNRWSLGIQSFKSFDLHYMNRAHNSEEALTALQNLQKWGSENITVDLIYGTPTLTDEAWVENIEQVIGMGINHISCYALTVEEGTALAHFIKKGKSAPLDPEKARRHFDILMEKAEAFGYIHYEISNFAKPGHISVHNANYWRGVSYLGIGPAAHSYNGISRRWNIAHNHKYMKSIQSGSIPYEEEILSVEDIYNEYVMTGLRTTWGVDLKKLDSRFKEIFNKGIQQFEQQGFVSFNEANQSFVLTRDGKHLADYIAMELFVG